MPSIRSWSHARISLFDPADPAVAEVAEPYKPGELAGVFEALYVLVRVEDELLQLAF